ncbi:MAG: hypothetical protein EA393_12590 [Bacteroidetes bacterium]|nr:MAG: hypothetical protein EA393_12590 [Bacteroidota bacterium]
MVVNLANSKTSQLFNLITDKLKEYIKDIRGIRKKGSFAQNFAFVFTGNAFFIIIQFVAAPILSRIYTPEAYGLFGIFNAIITNVVMVSTLMYPNALILPTSNRKFMHMIHLILFLVFLTSFASLIFVIFLGEFTLRILNAEGMNFFIYLIPIGILVFGINQVTSQWIVRLKAFKENMQIGSTAFAFIKGMTILYGIATNGAVNGITLFAIAGKLLGSIVQFFLIIKQFFFEKWELPRFHNMREIALEYLRFPKLVLPGNYLNLLSGQLPIYFLSFYFGSSVLGLFAFATSLLDMPMRLLGNAVSPVFYQKANELQNTKPSELPHVTYRLYNRLLFLGIIPFSFVTIFGDLIFNVIFGSQWTQAGLFAGYMSVYYLFRLISGPLTSIFNVLRKESLLFRFQLVLILTRFMALLVGVYVFKNEETTILLFGIFSSLAYILLNGMVFHVLNINPIKIIAKSFMYVAISLFLLFFLRFLLFLII